MNFLISILMLGAVGCTSGERILIENHVNPHLTSGTSPTGTSDSTVAIRGLGVGLFHTCKYGDEGTACWGLGGHGQLGTGEKRNSRRPQPVLLVDHQGTVTASAGGNKHNCFVLDQKEIYCVGNNTFGELGDRSMDGPKQTPVKVVGLPLGKTLLSGDKTLSVGDGVSCVILAREGDPEDGSLWCWGKNNEGQLGMGSATDFPHLAHAAAAALIVQSQSLPIRAALMVDKVTKVATRYHTCAIRQGQVYCFGKNSEGRVGQPLSFRETTRIPLIGIPVRSYTKPMPVVGLPGEAIDVAVGKLHSCAVMEDHSVYCWGRNDRGQLGLNEGSGPVTARSTQPLRVDLPVGVEAVSISSGSNFTCIRTNQVDHPIYCWGENNRGQLGRGDDLTSATPVLASDQPLPVEGIADLGEISAFEVGSNHSCLLIDNDKVYCYGDNSKEQLGKQDFLEPASSSPVLVD